MATAQVWELTATTVGTTQLTATSAGLVTRLEWRIDDEVVSTKTVVRRPAAADPRQPGADIRFSALGGGGA